MTKIATKLQIGMPITKQPTNFKKDFIFMKTFLSQNQNGNLYLPDKLLKLHSTNISFGKDCPTKSKIF